MKSKTSRFGTFFYIKIVCSNSIGGKRFFSEAASASAVTSASASASASAST